MNTAKYIIIHCTDVSHSLIPDQLQSVNQYHKSDHPDAPFPKSSLGYFVGYHRLITGGKNYKCREDWEEGAHCKQIRNKKSMNLQSLGVAVGFDGDIEYPRDEEKQLLKQQIKEWQKLHNIPDEHVYFHREFATWKTCPGKLIDSEWLNDLLAGEIATEPNQEQIDTLYSIVVGLLEKLKALIKNKNMNKKFGAFSSSADPEKLGKTVQGVIMAFSGIIIFVLSHFGIDVTELELNNQAANIGLIISEILIAYGAVQKLAIWSIEKFHTRTR
jgi:hypothetical protein